MKFPFIKVVKSEEETKEIADKFGSVLTSGAIITLNGELGTGKTFFVKSLLENWGIADVSSPTFSIVNTYLTENMKINHFDFYRIKREVELFDIGFDEYLSDENAITFIEWADMFEDVLPRKRYDVRIKYLENFAREIEIEQKH